MKPNLSKILKKGKAMFLSYDQGIEHGPDSDFNDKGIVSGIDLIEECVEILRNYKKTEILAASIRNVRQFREVADAGAHIATLPLKVIQQLLVHNKTREGMKNFTKDIVPEYADILK